MYAHIMYVTLKVFKYNVYHTYVYRCSKFYEVALFIQENRNIVVKCGGGIHSRIVHTKQFIDYKMICTQKGLSMCPCIVSAVCEGSKLLYYYIKEV